MNKPTLAEVISAFVVASTEFDDRKRNALINVLDRVGVEPFQRDGEAGFSLPNDLSRTILPVRETMRTGLETFGGALGGFVTPTGYAPSVLDRQRTTFGPCDQVDWWPVKEREFLMPVCNEQSRAAGSRWGGTLATAGVAENATPAPTDGRVAQVRFVNERVIITTNISRDLAADSDKVQRWLDYVASAEIRFQLETMILLGIPNVASMPGVVNHSSTIVIAKQNDQSAGTVEAINLDQMWSALSAGCKRNAAWYMNDDTFQYIDALGTSASGSQWPEIPYIPAGMYGNQYPTLKCRPILVNETLPAIGTPGDIILADLGQFICTYLEAPTGRLNMNLDVPVDKHHTGQSGLPQGAVGRLASEHFYFSTDLVALMFKFRGCGQFLWAGQTTNVNGKLVGPGVILAQR